MNFVGSSNSCPSPRSWPGVQSSTRGHSRLTGNTKYSLSTVLVWVFFLGKGEQLSSDVCLGLGSAWMGSGMVALLPPNASPPSFLRIKQGKPLPFSCRKSEKWGFFRVFAVQGQTPSLCLGGFILVVGAVGSCGCSIPAWCDGLGVSPCSPHPINCSHPVQGVPQQGWLQTLH